MARQATTRETEHDEQSTTMREEADRTLEARRQAAEHAPRDENLPAKTEQPSGNVAGYGGGIPGLVFKPKKIVSVPVLSWPDGATLVFRIDTPIHEGREISEAGRGPIQRKAHLMIVSVIMIEPGGKTYSIKKRTLVVGEVLMSELEQQPRGKNETPMPEEQKNYPHKSYVGKWFHVIKFAPNKDKDKAYATYGITEIENPAENLVFDELG
jgi:hypothetical protein